MHIEKLATVFATMVTGLALAGTPATAADPCTATLRQPTEVVRLWLATGARGVTPPCRLTVPHFDPSDPPFVRSRVAFVRPLAGQGVPGRRLYVVLMVSPDRAGTYLVDLRPNLADGWLIDLWAET
jgi:hypothetical protein